MCAMKVAIIGFSGAGKSTLAKQLSQIYQEEVLYMDTVYWLPNWVERPREETLEIVGEFLDTHDGWVIDGSYGAFHQARRLEEADEIIILTLNRFSCLWRAIKRRVEYHKKPRESRTKGCEEKLDFEFLIWLLWKGRAKRRLDKFKKIKTQYPQKTVVLKTQKQIDRFVKEKYKNKGAQSL